ncbi:unnamed protein product [Camellia sinensis]
MANSHNGHGTFADESWQDMYFNNTGFQSDNIPAEYYCSLDEDLKSFLETQRGVSHTEKTPWSVEEVLKVIVGVLSTTPKPGQKKRWQEIVEKYFQGEQTEEKLKQKWKELKKHATKKTDGEQWLFHMMAAIIEVDIQSDKSEVFNNVINEWCVTSETRADAIEACDWLISVKNMELEQQLNKIKDYVTDAEQNHAYDKIPYWSSQVHP